MNTQNKINVSNNIQTTRPYSEEILKTSLQRILVKENLDKQRALTKTLVTELNVDFLDFSAALLYLYQQTALPDRQDKSNLNRNIIKPPGIKMIRYRIEVGHQHQITKEQLTKVLVEESGVDKNNVHNVDIQNLFTLIELPDEMPQDIFLHLKSVEINHQKLDIKRVNNRSRKKRAHDRSRRTRQRKPKSANSS